MTTSFVSPQILLAVAAAMEEVGVPRLEFLRATGLDEQALYAGGPRLEREEFCQHVERALPLTHDDSFGLHWTERLSERSFAPLSNLVTHTKTLRRALGLIQQFTPLLYDGPVFELDEQADVFTIRARLEPVASAKLNRFQYEVLLGGLLKMIRACYSPYELPRAARFPYPEPAGGAADYVRVFGAGVAFNQEHTELVFEAALLDRPTPYADSEMHAAMHRVVEGQLSRVAQQLPWSMRVRSCVLQQLPARPTMMAVAEALGMSERTLRRHLSAEGISYREVESAVLAEHAKGLLREPSLTIQQAAEQMGYADAATFHRAFKAWTGLTPAGFRDKG